MKPKHLIFSLLAMFASHSAKAAVGDTFTANTTEGVTMTFKIISEDDLTVMVGDESASTDVSIDHTTAGSITIPSTVSNNGQTYTVTQLGFRAFYGCSNLTAVTIPSTVTSFGQAVFARCTSLTTVNIPEGITRLNDEMFWGCTSLSSITLPSTLTIINEGVFYDCNNLTTVTVNATNPPGFVVTGTYDPFPNRTNATINVPSGTKATYSAASIWRDCKKIHDPADFIEFEDDYTKNICVSKWDTNHDGELSYAEAAAVTSLGNTFKNSSIKSFNEFKYFTGVTAFGSSITNSPENCIYYCKSLTSISIPKSVTSIGKYAFEGCSSLAKVEFASIEQYFNITYAAYESNPLHYAHHLYINGSEVKDLVIPEGITSIPSQFFNGCTGFTSVTFPNTLTTIGSNAFSGCRSLTSLTFPNTLTSINSGAFDSCSSLTSLTFPNSISYIGSSAFQSCSKLNSVTFGNNVNSIGSSAFNGTSIGVAHFTSTSPISSIADDTKLKFGTIVVPDAAVDDYKTAWTNVAERIVGESDYNTLKSYTVSANASSSALVEEVGENNTLKVVKLKISGTINSYDMFVMKTKMVNLRELDLSDATIVANAYNYGTDVSANNVFPDFLNGKILFNLILPNTITEIKSGALSNCPGFESITIPASVITIGSRVFRSQLRSVEFAPSSQLTTISSSAFKGTSIESFVAPASLTTLGANAFENCTSLISVTLSVPQIGNYAFKGCTSLATVTLQNGVTTIGNYAFEGCTALKNVTIPTGVTSIGSYAFNGCSALPNIELPQSLTTISQYAFQNCTSLASVTINEGLTLIGNYAFSGCSTLPNITLPQSLTSVGQYAFLNCTKLESITIPSVKTISQYTFSGCTILGEVKMSPQTTTIEQGAFSNCKALTEIHLPPFLNTIGNGAFGGCNNLMTIYAYMPDIITIGTNTFPNQANATLYVPAFLYNNYYYDTNWGKFLNVLPCDLQPGDYAAFYTNGDIIFGEGEQRITQDTPIAEIGAQGGIIVQGEAQQFDTVDQTIGDMNTTSSTGASLIGDGTTAQENNLPMNELRVKMTVQAKKWYFFCFPFDVTIEQCEYPGRYVWRYYDGAIRAANGSGGWQPVTGETLTARQGYAFQSETAGTLVVKFNHPTFGGDRVKELVAHATSNAANASWNFIGNPYSSYYDFRSEDITSPITIWNGSSYVAYRPGDDECHLKPYQAFFVQKPTASVQVTFNVQRRETYRQSEATKAARQAKRKEQGISPKRRLINLEIMSDTVMLDRTRVVLNPEAASAYELECDAAKFLSDDSKAQIYSVENGIQMAINERPLAGDIRLGYTAKKAGRLSISAPRMDIPMVLVDMKLGITFDLTLGTYDFDTSAGTFNDRFLLRQGGDATAINNLTAKTGVCFGTQDGGIAIGGAEGKTVNVYTTGGALAAQHSGNGFIALKSGIYVVSVDGVSAKVRVR